MENYLEYIDAYFNNVMSKEEAILFEKKVEDDREFAEEVAFYLSAKQSLKEQVNVEKKERFRQLLSQSDALSNISTQAPVRRIVVYRIAAAAAILICVFFAGYLFLFKSASPQKLADNYINANLQTVGIKMSAESDSMDEGKRMYNEARYDSAIRQFESIAQRDTANYQAIEYLGKVYLRTGNYEKALLEFQHLENYTSLYSNPAVFLKALTLMKRNQLGDREQARRLLQQVVNQDLDQKETAEQWLKKKW